MEFRNSKFASNSTSCIKLDGLLVLLRFTQEQNGDLFSSILASFVTCVAFKCLPGSGIRMAYFP